MQRAAVGAAPHGGRGGRRQRGHRVERGHHRQRSQPGPVAAVADAAQRGGQERVWRAAAGGAAAGLHVRLRLLLAAAPGRLLLLPRGERGRAGAEPAGPGLQQGRGSPAGPSLPAAPCLCAVLPTCLLPAHPACAALCAAGDWRHMGLLPALQQLADGPFCRAHLLQLPARDPHERPEHRRPGKGPGCCGERLLLVGSGGVPGGTGSCLVV